MLLSCRFNGIPFHSYLLISSYYYVNVYDGINKISNNNYVMSLQEIARKYANTEWPKK